MCLPSSPLPNSAKETTTTGRIEKPPTSGTVGLSKGHPLTLEGFYWQHPSFIWGPMLVAAFLYALTSDSRWIPALLQDYMKSQGMQVFGFRPALHYTLFAILSSYAFHGWCATHAPSHLKIQSGKKYDVQPNAMAVRSTAALTTELVYTFLPLAPTSSSWVQFFVWTAVVAIYWDAHFYVGHRYVHENKAAYRFFHKTHHLCKDPNCFAAYFVTYQSHVALEQLVVFILAMAGMPKDVFIFTMYWGTILTYVEHSGYELSSVKLPLVPFTFGNLCTVLGLSTSFLDGVNVAEHDWHHEKFTENYGLSFTYLDKIFGTYNPGRVPGEQESKANKD